MKQVIWICSTNGKTKEIELSFATRLECCKKTAKALDKAKKEGFEHPYIRTGYEHGRN